MLLLSLLAFQVNFCACELISCNDVEVGIELDGGGVVAVVGVVGFCPVNLTFGPRRTDEYSVSRRKEKSKELSAKIKVVLLLSSYCV